MIPIQATRKQAARYERNLGKATAPEKSALTRAKSELMTDYMKEYMQVTGLRVMTVEILHSAEYLNGLKKFMEIFLSLKLAAMKERTTK